MRSIQRYKAAGVSNQQNSFTLEQQSCRSNAFLTKVNVGIQKSKKIYIYISMIA